MENIKIIEFQLTRDFSHKMNATFTFTTQNFKGLFRSLLYIAGPPVLVASLLFSSFITDIFSLSFQVRVNPSAITNYFATTNFWLQITFALVFFVVSVVVTTATVYNYLILYGEKKSNAIEVNEVWERVRSTFWMYFSTTLLYALMAIVVYILMIIPAFVLGAISPFLVFFAVLFLLGVFVYLINAASLVYVIRAFEKLNFFEAIARSFYLIRGKWWSTFGLYMVLSLLVGTISSIFFVPAYIIILIQSFHNIQTENFQSPTGTMGIIVTAFMTLYYLSQMVLTCLPNIGLAFQYFNLVELKEAKGLMSEIETFGQPQPPTQQEEHY